MAKFGKKVIRSLTRFFFSAKALNKDEMLEVWKNSKTICVLSASGIGDSIMATPLIEEIKRCRLGSRLIVVSTVTCALVFKGNPNIDLIMRYTYGIQYFFSFVLLLFKLRKEHINVLFAAQPSNTIRHSLITAFSNAKIRLKHSYDYVDSSERDFSFVYSKLLPDNMERHRVELNLDLLRFLGEEIQENSIYPSFIVSKEVSEKIETLLETNDDNRDTKKLIAIHPGGGRENKRWSPERFAELGKILIKDGFTISLIGGESEKSLADNIAEKIDKNVVFNFTGKFSLEETAALLKKVFCLISNDTGIMHLATAVRIPVIALFGPTDFRHIGPFSKASRILSNSININDITPSEVLDTLFTEINSGVSHI
jgi:heptosyltransferase-2